MGVSLPTGSGFIPLTFVIAQVLPEPRFQTRKCRYNDLSVEFRAVFRRLLTLVFATLALLVLLGGSSVLFGLSSSVFAATHASCQADETLYVVKRGDTLSWIALNYHSNVWAIAQANKIANVNLIFPGQHFCIPSETTVTQSQGKVEGCSAYYTVVRGDTLSQIALNYHSRVWAIAQANKIANVNLIFPGQHFCIPSANTETAVTQSQASQNPATSATSTAQQTASADPSVASMIDQVFGPYAAAAQRVAQCESGWNPGAYNSISVGGSHAEGVFQILYPSTWVGTQEAASSPYNAMSNILAAHEIFVRDGYSWREWVCQP
jgi:LysM repeat protein